MDAHPAHPVRLVVEDDLARNRLTVFFRLILAIPHFFWITLWSVGMIFISIANWIVTLVTGSPAKSLHGWTCAYVRYSTHLNAYLYLTASPYPGFTGEEGQYPIDLRLPPPGPQKRWKTFFRIFIAVPALLLASALAGGGGGAGYTRTGGKWRYSGVSARGALAGTCAFLGWFAILARGSMPKGLRDASAYGVGYGAQTLAYLLFVTERYPDADPNSMLDGVGRPPEHVVRLVGDADDLRLSRVTVFFRLLLTVPHSIWLALWGIAACFAVLANWFVILFRGAPAAGLHAFVSRYVRYQLHVYAFLFLAANPFPGFDGAPGRYPIDLVLPAPARQDRWKTGFRIVLAVPALFVSTALGYGLGVTAFLTWFVGLARGAAPWGLRNYAAYALRYQAQVNAYLALVTDAYPHASPLEGAPTPEHEFAEAAAPA
ncbi:MAG: DUF4389 domain-containing protein [Actinobacteria bacterium]|nr:DUF4389 domain-containing protein [Actinomycetota bacterium]